MSLIHGVQVKTLKRIPDDRGCLTEILRCDDPQFIKFGQVYITSIRPGVIKAWHWHKIQTDNLMVITSMAKLVLYDARKDSPTYDEVNEFWIGECNPLLITVPPLVWHGFKNISTTEAIILNCCSEPYNYREPDEYRESYHERQDHLTGFIYHWNAGEHTG